GTKSFGNCLRGFASRSHDAVSEFVGIDAGNATFPQFANDVALAGGDTASQGDPQHQPSRRRAAVTVFFSSIAIVNGPTPPGTGVRAPATSSTLGCTSPITREPRFSKAVRRLCPGSNHSAISAASLTGVVPTSTTVLPGFTKSAVT